MIAADILEVNEKIRKTEKELQQVKSSFKSKEDDLILYTDWQGLKETASISNQKMRDAYISENLRDDKSQLVDLEIELEFLKRLFQVLLLEKSQRYSERVHHLESEINLLRMEIPGGLLDE